MSNNIKEQAAILSKLSIEKLNPMQKEAIESIEKNSNTLLISPTGTGKTLAFLLPTIAMLDSTCDEIQSLILVPTRELAIQIEQVLRMMGTGYKINAVYGGRAGSKDRIDLKHKPAILIGTPGRVADHIRREAFLTNNISTLILDEFDKSLEIGFESEMFEILAALPNLKKRILTSATQRIAVPKFVKLDNPILINYAGEEVSQLKLKKVTPASQNQLEALVEVLQHVGNHPGIVFCNFKDTIEEVSNYLFKHKIQHGCFHGDMEQRDRELALIKFRNGTHQLLIATDLAARGLDIPELKFIIHFQLPNRVQEFTHRNGRTARMNADGTAFVLKFNGVSLPEFTESATTEKLHSNAKLTAPKWDTLFISGGRKDKISKGDVAGLFIKKGNLSKDQIGIIEIKKEFTFVAVDSAKANQIIKSLNNERLKKKKVRITLA